MTRLIDDYVSKTINVKKLNFIKNRLFQSLQEVSWISIRAICWYIS